MKGSLVRASHVIFVAAFAYISVPLLAADRMLPTVGFGDTPDSVNLATITGPDGQRLFTPDQVSAITSGDCSSGVTQHSFKADVDPVTALADDAQTAENSALSLVNSCEIAGQGNVKILTVQVSTVSGDDVEEGIARISITSGTGETAVTKVLAQKVLHHIRAKTAATLAVENPCGIEGNPLAGSMRVRVDTCEVTQFFRVQVPTTGMTFNYAVTGNDFAPIDMEEGTTTYHMVNRTAANLEVTATAMRDGTQVGASHRIGRDSTLNIEITGTAGLSQSGFDAAASDTRTQVVLGQTLAARDVIGYFDIDTTDGSIRYEATPTSGLEADILVSLNPQAVNLTVKGIAVGDQSVTVSATHNPTSGDPTTVEIVLNYTVRDTQIFKTLTLRPVEEWPEETEVDLDKTGGLNDLLADNVDPIEGTDVLDVTYTVTSEPEDLFEVEANSSTGDPELSWATGKMVPSYEDDQQVVIELTGAVGTEDEGEVMTITIEVEDTDDSLDATDCTDGLDTVYLSEGESETVGYAGAISKMVDECVSDEDNTFTGSISGASNPSADYELDSDGDVERGIYAEMEEGEVVVTTAGEDTAGTSSSTVTVIVTVTNDATPPETKDVQFNFDVVMLTGTNTPPRFPGGATQVQVSLDETAVAGRLVGPPSGDSWAAKDVNSSSGGDGDVVKHRLGTAEGTGYCLVVDEDTATVRTGECGIDAEGVASNPFSVNLIAEDRFGGSASLEIRITVNDVPESPERNNVDLPMSVDLKTGDGPFRIDLDTYFEDPEGNQLEYDVQSNNEMVTVVTKGSDGVIFLTSGSQSGSTTITATVTGPLDAGETAPDPINIPTTNFIQADNTAPVFANGLSSASYAVSEGAADGTPVGRPFAVTNGAAGSHEANFDKLTYTIEGSDAFRVSSDDADAGQMMVIGGMLDYDTTPTEEFSLKVTDRFGESDSLNVTIEVQDANEPPFVTDAGMNIAPQVVVESGTTTLNARPFFDDPDQADRNRLFLRPEVNHSDRLSVAVDGDHNLIMTGLEPGAVEVTLTAVDSDGNEASTEFDVTVLANSAPTVANPIPDQEFTKDEIVDIPLTEVFADPDSIYGDVPTVTSASSNNSSVVIVALNSDNTELTLIGRTIGTATITVTATDFNDATVSDTFEAEVLEEEEPEGENQAPTLDNPISGVTVTEGNTVDVDLSDTFSDPDDDTLTLTAESSATDIATVNEIGSDNMLTITAGDLPDGTRFAIANITVTATDPDDATASDQFSVIVLRDNSSPTVIASIDAQNVTRGTPLLLDVSNVFIDEDPDDDLTLTVSVDDETIATGVVDNGMVELVLDGLAPGATSVTLQATDLFEASASTDFDLTVDTRPEVIGTIAPIALEIGGDVFELKVDELFRDDDGDAMTVSAELSPSGIASQELKGMVLVVSPNSRGNATLTVTVTDDAGHSATLTGSVAVGDGEIRKVAEQSLAGLGRSIIASVSDSMGQQVLSGSRYSDFSFSPSNGSDTEGVLSSANPDIGVMGVFDQDLWTTDEQNVVHEQPGRLSQGLNRSQNFSFSFGRSQGLGIHSVWGTTDVQSFGGSAFEGSVANTYFGVDLVNGDDFKFGVAAARNAGTSDYRYGNAEQSMVSHLTTVLPYFRYDFNGVTSVWGVAGLGSGSLESTVVGASNQASDLHMDMYMVGARRGLSRVGMLDVAVRADMAFANLETDEGEGAVDSLAASVNRIRAGVESSLTVNLPVGTISPFGEVSLRHDGGDGQEGSGVEVSGGIRLLLRGFNLEARGRTLASSGIDDYSEDGYGVTATLNPSADGSGLSFTIAPRWGGSAQSTGAMWNDQTVLNGGLSGSRSNEEAMAARIGYGKRVLNDRYMLTPFIDFDTSDNGRQTLVGGRLGQLIQGRVNLNVDFALGKVVRRDTGEVDSQVGVNATLRF